MAFAPETGYKITLTAVPIETKTHRTTVSIPNTGPVHESLSMGPYTNMSQSVDVSALKSRIYALEQQIRDMGGTPID